MFNCVWKTFSVSFFFMVLSFFVEMKPFLFQGPDSSACIIWTVMQLCTVKWSLTSATTKPVLQVENWCTGCACFCEEKNKGLREWWRLEVGGVIEGGERQTYLRIIKGRSVTNTQQSRKKKKRKERREQRCLMWHHHVITTAVWLRKYLDEKKHPPARTFTLYSVRPWARWPSMTR